MKKKINTTLPSVLNSDGQLEKSQFKSKKRNHFRADVKQTKALKSAAKSASKNAIRASKALGLTITYLENGEIIREHADGKKEIVGKIKLIKNNSLPLKKGMILHARK